MAFPTPLFSRIQFGVFELDAASGELRKAGIPIKLRLQAVQVLLMLTDRAGQVVTREEIRERLWSADTFVDFEHSINFCINQIRGALGDDAERPRYVETLPRRGYRFRAPVTVELPRERSLTVATAHGSTEIHRGAGESSAVSSASSGILVVPAHPAQVPVALGTRKRWVVMGVAGILASLAAGFGTHKWLSRNRDPNLQDMRITKLTHSGSVTGVTISPDGRYVVYAKLDGERQGLWLHQIATQSDVQILSPDTGFHGLTFSPDGNYIYFVRSDKNNRFFKYLYSMPALGGPVRKLLTDVDSPVSFSSDGRRFVYEHCVESRDDIELRMANADGGDDHVLAVLHGGSSLLFQPGPTWSPDGRTIAVPALLVGPQGRWVLDAVSVADGGVRELFSRPNEIGRPVWLPGGDTLLMPLYDPAGHRAQLWTISFPGGKARRFTNDLTSYGAGLEDYGFPLDRTHDGKALVALATTEAAKVWMAPGTAPWEAQEITKDELPLFHVAEAADGKLWSVSGDDQLWIMNPDGSQGAPYGNFHNIDSIAACERFMILVQSESSPKTLVRVDADGGRHPTRLASGNLFGPVCSPDGKFVFYLSTEQPQKIWSVPIQGGAPLEIARALGDQITGPPSISPDGTLISYGYTKFDPKLGWNVAVIPAGGGPPAKTMPTPAEGWGLAWARDGKGVQYLLTRNGVTNIWEQPLSGGKPRQVTKFTSGLIFEFNWSFDHQRLLLTRGEITSDAVLLSNLH